MKKFFKSTLSIAASAVIVFSAITYPFGTASATPWELERYELQNMPYLNPDDEPATCDANAPGGGSSGGIGGPLVGSTNLEKVYNYFLRQGVSKNTAAAITGSIWQESKGDPLLIQGAGGHLTQPMLVFIRMVVGLKISQDKEVSARHGDSSNGIQVTPLSTGKNSQE